MVNESCCEHGITNIGPNCEKCYKKHLEIVKEQERMPFIEALGHIRLACGPIPPKGKLSEIARICDKVINASN